MSWTWQRDSCSLHRCMTTSLYSSANCTGWEHRMGFSSSLLFSCTSVCTGQHHRISPMSSSTRPISRPGDAIDLLHHCRWMSVVHGASTVGDRAFPYSCCQYETVCPNMSRLHLCMSVFLKSPRASRLSSSGVPSRDFFASLNCLTYTYIPGPRLPLQPQKISISLSIISKKFSHKLVWRIWRSWTDACEYEDPWSDTYGLHLVCLVLDFQFPALDPQRSIRAACS